MRTPILASAAAVILTAGALVLPSAAMASNPEACDPATATTTVYPSPPEYRPSSGFTHSVLADARGKTWETTQVEGWYPVILKDASYPAGGTFCFLGGTIDGNDTTSSWDTTWHKSVSFYTDHPYTTIRGARIDGGGDCIGIKDPGDASLTRIQGVALTACGDDAIENDLMKNVEVVDSVVEGYVVFGGRGGSAGAEDGRNNTYKIDRVIAHLRPQVDVYKGTSPGNGPLFKRPNADGSQGYEPNYTITNSIFRVDKVPNHGDLSIPPGPHANNTVVWTGSGSYPGPVPAGFTVTTDLSVWQNARNAWFAVPQADRSQPGVYSVGTTTPPPSPTPDPEPEPDPETPPPPPPATSGIVDRQVDSAADDVEERLYNGRNTTSSSDLEIGLDGTVQQWVGVRFKAVAVPQGATITRAYLGFTADTSEDEYIQIQVYGHGYDNAPAFSTADHGLSSRPLAVGEDRWFPESWVAGQTSTTPDISEVVKAIVDRPGWVSGNAMSFTLFVDSDTPGATRNAEAYDGSSSRAPTLHIEYAE